MSNDYSIHLETLGFYLTCIMPLISTQCFIRFFKCHAHIKMAYIFNLRFLLLIERLNEWLSVCFRLIDMRKICFGTSTNAISSFYYILLHFSAFYFFFLCPIKICMKIAVNQFMHTTDALNNSFLVYENL